MAKRIASVARGTFIQQSRGIASELKATFHQVTGAGRSRVLRQYLGVAPSDEPALKSAFERAIGQRIKAL